MNVVLNGQKFKCLVDTGSACTLIRRRVATELGLRIETENTVLTTFSGTCVASVGVAKIKVRVGQPSAVLQVVVVNDKQMLHYCIIGRLHKFTGSDVAQNWCGSTCLSVGPD
jgi:predicted aspartyl protease